MLNRLRRRGLARPPQFAGTSGDEQSYQVLHELNAEFHRIVRGSGGGNATRGVAASPCRPTSGFFNSIDDGAHMTLTFHFWSGATVTYSVTKSGTAITGAAG